MNDLGWEDPAPTLTLRMSLTSTTDRGYLLTEQTNPASQTLDQLSSLELVDLFNQEDAKVLDRKSVV